MNRILEILTDSDDSLARSCIEAEMELPDCEVELVELSESGLDYGELLQKIFQADLVHVW